MHALTLLKISHKSKCLNQSPKALFSLLWIRSINTSVLGKLKLSHLLVELPWPSLFCRNFPPMSCKWLFFQKGCVMKLIKHVGTLYGGMEEKVRRFILWHGTKFVPQSLKVVWVWGNLDMLTWPSCFLLIGFCVTKTLLWSTIIRRKYGYGSSGIPIVNTKRPNSNFWRGLCATWETFCKNLTWRVVLE